MYHSIRVRTLVSSAAGWLSAGCALGALCFSAGIGLMPISSGRAQKATGSIAGSLIDAASGAPIIGAAVQLSSNGSKTTSDSAGRFQYLSLLTGVHLLQIRAVGYTSASRIIELAEGEVSRPVFEMKHTAHQLSTVEVRDSATHAGKRFVDFERRRALGRGQFFTQDEIKRQNAGTLTDLLRTARGLREECRLNGCTVRMARSPAGCWPEYFVDGFASNAFGPSTPLRDIEGVEVYLGQSETPAEFLGRNSGCGVVVVWTRSAP